MKTYSIMRSKNGWGIYQLMFGGRHVKVADCTSKSAAKAFAAKLNA